MISTKNIPGSGKASKTLEPGNGQVMINNIYLEEFTYTEGAYNLMLNCEGPDMGSGFEGFFIDKTKESLGRHKGQVGRVRASKWAYADKTIVRENDDDIIIVRDNEIVKMLKHICTATGCIAWFEAEDGKHATIEALVTAMNAAKPFAGKFMNVCLAGKEYENKGGYINHDLYFPKFSKKGFPFQSAETVDGASKVFTFNAEDHIDVKKVKAAPAQFEPAPEAESGAGEFSLED